MELQQAQRDVYRPTMVRKPKAPGNQGTEVLMVDAGSEEPPEEGLSPLVVGKPVLTGEPVVGQTLICSEPSIEGGSGDLTINYYWQDVNSKSVLYMGATQVVREVDVSRTECCQVYVADNQTGEKTTVVSNAVGPIRK